MTVRARLCSCLASCIAHVGASVAGSFNVWSYHRGFRARCVLAMGAASCQRAATHMLASVPLATLRCYHHSGTRRWAASVHAAVVSAVGLRENGARLCVRTCCGGLYRSVSAHHMCCVVTTTGRTTLPTRLGAMSPMQCQMYARALLVVCRSCVKPARSRCGGRIVSTAGVCAAAGAIVTAMRAYPEPVLRAAHTTAQACAARARSIVGRVRPGGKLVRCVAHCLWVRHGGCWGECRCLRDSR